MPLNERGDKLAAKVTRNLVITNFFAKKSAHLLTIRKLGVSPVIENQCCEGDGFMYIISFSVCKTVCISMIYMYVCIFLEKVDS